MTFVATITSRRTIWMVADRRLTVGDRPVTDNAVKIFALNTSDGTALIGYAGLGRTINGMQPSEWMSNVLRGRNWPMNTSMKAIADAMTREVPRHLARARGACEHVIVAPAFVNNRPRLYGTGLKVDSRGIPTSAFHVLLVRDATTAWPHRMTFSGSGSKKVKHNEKHRALLRLANAYDAGKIFPTAVADKLAELSFNVSREDKFTGPKSIVAWRSINKGSMKGGSGGHHFYDGLTRETDTPALPSIGHGLDVAALANAIWQYHTPRSVAALEGKPALPNDPYELRRLTEGLPSGPDEELR